MEILGVMNKLLFSFFLCSLVCIGHSCIKTNIQKDIQEFAAMLTTTVDELSHFFTPDHFMPKLEDLNIVTFTPMPNGTSCRAAKRKDAILAVLKRRNGFIKINGTIYKISSEIPVNIAQHTKPVCIYSGGYSNGDKPYAFSAYHGIKGGTFTGPCIVFDCITDKRRSFNFCQEQDLKCLDLVYQDLIAKHPKAEILLYGGCKGGANQLRFVAEKAEKQESLQNIKAMIVESPPVSVERTLKHVRHGGKFSHFLCQMVMPNYDPKKLKTILHAKVFPTTIPVLVGSLPHDPISGLKDIVAMNNHLISKGANIKHFICQGDDVKLKHGKIGLSKEWHQTVLTFLANNGLHTS